MQERGIGLIPVRGPLRVGARPVVGSAEATADGTGTLLGDTLRPLVLRYLAVIKSNRSWLAHPWDHGDRGRGLGAVKRPKPRGPWA